MSIDNPMNLSERLVNKIDRLSNTDPDWVTFVQDHVKYIKEQCRIIPMTDVIRDRFHYKFEHFIRENQCNQNIGWIARLINDLTMYEDFTLKPSILLPDITQINNLYRRYRTSRNNT